MNFKIPFDPVPVVIIIAGIAAAMIGVMFWVALSNTQNKTNSFIICTAEGKSCPDGSTVGRVPPDCRFELCPGEKPKPRECEIAEHCAESCNGKQCEPFTYPFPICSSAGECSCTCVRDMTIDPTGKTVQLRNGPVSTVCEQDSDCTIVNSELDFRECLPGYCDIVDYSEDKYVAVNAHALAEFVDLFNTGACGVQPSCPTQFIDSGYVARCADSLCRKVKP